MPSTEIPPRGSASGRSGGRSEFGGALAIQALGAALVLAASAASWQTISTPRPAPLATDVLTVSGRTVDTAPTALALVALAGVVAVLATRAGVRRGVGAVVALAGAAIVWRCVGVAPVGVARARTLVSTHHPAVDTSAVLPRVTQHGGWPALGVVGGVLVLLAGLLVLVRGGRWRAMSQRYEAPSASGATPEPAGMSDGGGPTRAPLPGSGSDHGESTALPSVGPVEPVAPARLWTAFDQGQDPTDAG